MNRQQRRAHDRTREQAVGPVPPPWMDEKQVLMLRLGQKDAQLFVMEMQLNAAQVELARLNGELDKFQPMTKGEIESGEGGTNLDQATDVPEGEGI